MLHFVFAAACSDGLTFDVDAMNGLQPSVSVVGQTSGVEI